MTAESQPNSKRRTSVCVGCGSQIQDQFIMRVAPDLEWHAGCLKCADCDQYLDESCTCFVRDGKTYCKRDYVRLFGSKCSKCGLGFSKNDFVMRAKTKIFHIDCFRCVACSRQLIPGDEFALRDDGLFCKADHEVVERSGPICDPGSPHSNSASDNNNDNSRVNNNKNSHSEKNGGLQLAGRAEHAGSKKGPRASHKSDHKTTRVRTVLNEKQLHTLRTCYNANPRPDALMKEQLVEMTSLSPRVIRVWFQNKRCKDKKRSILMKQIQQQQEKNGNGLQRPLQGVPMVASSPVRHEGPGIQASPVEVQSYQTPWKALSEFAMQGEIDHHHPPFQQLMSTFDTMEPHCGGPSPHSDPLMHVSYLHHDDMPNSVSSDFPRTPSELSSPLSQ